MNTLLRVLKNFVLSSTPISFEDWLRNKKTIKINTKYEIPYLAGYSFNGMIIYIDRRLLRWLTLEDGSKIDLFKYLIVHELYEKYMEDTRGYKYQYAHELATKAEREAVERDRIAWDTYQNHMLKMVKKLKTFADPLPEDLDTKPEKDTHDYYRYHKIEKLKKINDLHKQHNSLVNPVFLP